MNFYQPELSTGQSATSSFLYLGYKLILLWPLESQASRFAYFIKHSVVVYTLICYILTNLGHIFFIYEHSHDIAAVSECLSTLLMGIQFLFRTALIGWRHRQMRQLFERFYREIHFESSIKASWYGKLTKNVRFITILTGSYWIPMVLKVLVFPLEVMAAGGMSSKTKPFFYRMSFPWYDVQNPMNFIITSIYTGWIDFSCTILMAADDYLLCLILIHTSYRYKELQQVIEGIYTAAARDAASSEGGRNDAHFLFKQRLHDALRQQQRLDSFVEEAKMFFTYQIFCCLSFGMVVLCVVSFHLQKVPFGADWLMYILWLNSVIAQLTMIGFFGQKLMNGAMALGDSYYMCHWESVLEHADSHANKSLLNDIKFAIMRAERGVVFDGKKMFILNHRTVGYVLRSALSYFMFLNTVHEST